MASGRRQNGRRGRLTEGCLGLVLGLVVITTGVLETGCAPYRRVSADQRDRITRGRCELGGEPQGMVAIEMGGMAMGVPLGGLVVVHLESGREFALAIGRVLAMLPTGRYRIKEWWGADIEAEEMYRGQVKASVVTVNTGQVAAWGRFRLVEAGGKIALAHIAGEHAIQVQQDGPKVTVTWTAGDPETFDAGRCLGAPEGRAHTDTASIGGLTVLIGGGVALLSGDMASHGTIFKPSEPVASEDVADVGGIFQVGIGWSFGSLGFPVHEIGLSFAWAGFGTNRAGTSVVEGTVGELGGEVSPTLIGLHGVAQYLARPAPRWIVSPLLGLGTGVFVANVGNTNVESDPDLAWSLQLHGGVDVRITEDLGVRASYVFTAPLVGESLPFTHQFVVSISILAGGDLWW